MLSCDHVRGLAKADLGGFEPGRQFHGLGAENAVHPADCDVPGDRRDFG